MEGERQDAPLRAGAALYRAQSPQSAGARAETPARGDQRGLQQHDFRRDPRGDRGASQALHPQVAAQASCRRRHRRPATACLRSSACRRVNGRAHGPPTPSSDCTKSSSGGSRRRPCFALQRPLPCCSGRCSPQDRSPCARLMAGRRSTRSPAISHLTSRLDQVFSKCRRCASLRIPTKFATAPLRSGTIAITPDPDAYHGDDQR